MAVDRTHLDPEFKRRLAALEALLPTYKLNMRVTAAYRSREEQAELYNNRKPGAVVAPPGKSKHEVGKAADFCFRGKDPWTGNWAMFGHCARQVGLKWGGDWKRRTDRPHVELP
jgi:peptidoglycan LD-endopeptidase CwlK